MRVSVLINALLNDWQVLTKETVRQWRAALSQHHLPTMRKAMQGFTEAWFVT
jgi:hypothetical protein